MKVFIYCRYPELGKVKTRLAADCGDAGALAVYKKLLHIVFQNLKESSYPFEVHYTGGEKLEVEYWLQEMHCQAQIGDDLGEKLRYSVSKWFKSNDTSLVIIGSDQPDIDETILKETEEKLKSHEVIIGPAKDGGYYLIAMNKAYLSLFEGISWSTEKVLQQTLGKILEQGLSYYLLPEKVDIDHFEDVPEEWKKELMLHENTN